MFEKLTLLAMAKKQMDWLSQRQEVLSENIANANTPKYKPKDLRGLDFKKVLSQVQPAVMPVSTNPGHIVPPMQDPQRVLTERLTFESSPDGNAIVLEEQMAKVGSSKTAYDLAASLMQKHVRLLRTAIGGRG